MVEYEEEVVLRCIQIGFSRQLSLTFLNKWVKSGGSSHSGRTSFLYFMIVNPDQPGFTRAQDLKVVRRVPIVWHKYMKSNQPKKALSSKPALI